MTEWPRLSDRPVDALLERAADYRRMAAAARTVEDQQSLLSGQRAPVAKHVSAKQATRTCARPLIWLQCQSHPTAPLSSPVAVKDLLIWN